jgi:hypothetical protein
MAGQSTKENRTPRGARPVLRIQYGVESARLDKAGWREMSVATNATKLLLFLAAAQTPHPATLTLPERIALARPILLQAEAAAAAAGPANRAFLLYRAGGAWLDLDRAHAIELDRQAFASARQIDSIYLRKDAEHDILSDLVALSPSAVLDLIGQAEPETQQLMYRATINFSLIQSDLPEAIKAFNQASATGVFSEQAATYILSAIPDSDAAARVRIFNSAIAAYKAQTPDQSHSWSA